MSLEMSHYRTVHVENLLDFGRLSSPISEDFLLCDGESGGTQPNSENIDFARKFDEMPKGL